MEGHSVRGTARSYFQHTVPGCNGAFGKKWKEIRLWRQLQLLFNTSKLYLIHLTNRQYGKHLFLSWSASCPIIRNVSCKTYKRKQIPAGVSFCTQCICVSGVCDQLFHPSREESVGARVFQGEIMVLSVISCLRGKE